MEDTLKSILFFFSRLQKQKNYRHPLTDGRSVATDPTGSVARPHMSLKARMLGGQVETIMRLGGSQR